MALKESEASHVMEPRGIFLVEIILEKESLFK